MSDKFKSYSSGLRDPIAYAQEVTPDDATDLEKTSRAIYVGGAGDLQVTLMGGDIATFHMMPVGWHPIRVSRIWATGTTATHVVTCC